MYQVHLIISYKKDIIMFMSKITRKDERYEEIGTVDCSQLCALSGILDDISMSGCKVHFPIPVEYDPESEYTLILRISRKTESAAMEMICKPIWINILENKSFMGFSFLRSPDTPELSSLIEESNK